MTSTTSLNPGTRTGRRCPITPAYLRGMQQRLWPNLHLYDKQRELIEAVLSRTDTYCPAAHKVGKDFVAGYLTLSCFLACIGLNLSCRIITTSVAEHHLKVLWGEIANLLATSAVPLILQRGGPLAVNHLEIRRASEQVIRNPVNYLIGRVSEHGEGLAGHHADFTLAVGDESSGLSDDAYQGVQGWAKHRLWIGNPNECDNFFRRGVKEHPERVVKIRALDSPNVARELDPRYPDRHVYPGLLTLAEYQERRQDWDPIKQCTGLDAEFYEGAEVRLFPNTWLDIAEARHQVLAASKTPRTAHSIGIDTAEGGDQTVWAVVDELGLIELISLKTPNTAIIPGRTLALMRQYKVPAERVVFDRGGGGKQHADQLRAQGYPVQTVAFGEGVTPDPLVDPSLTRFMADAMRREGRTTYTNRRSQMYGELRSLLDPALEGQLGCPSRFALPHHPELRSQLAVIPLTYDREGRLSLLPKTNPRDGTDRRTLVGLIGHSPDECDALVLGIYSLLHPVRRVLVGALR